MEIRMSQRQSQLWELLSDQSVWYWEYADLCEALRLAPTMARELGRDMKLLGFPVCKLKRLTVVCFDKDLADEKPHKIQRIYREQTRARRQAIDRMRTLTTIRELAPKLKQTMLDMLTVEKTPTRARK